MKKYLPFIVPVLFLIWGFLHIDDYGVTVDEFHRNYYAEESLSIAARAFTGDFSIDWRTRNSKKEFRAPGYYFVLETLRAAWIKFLRLRFGITDWVLGAHSYQLLISSFALFFTYLLVQSFFRGSYRTPLFSCLFLALHPQFIAHAQNNPKDMAALFFFPLCLYLVHRLWIEKRMRFAVLIGVLTGLAWTTRVICVVIPVIGVITLVVTNRQQINKRLFLLLLLSGLLTVIFFVLFWPWLWRDPLGRFLVFFDRVSHLSTKIPVMWLGKIYTSENVPWPYFMINLFATTSTLYWFLWISGIIGVLWKKNKNHSQRSLAVLCIIWMGVLIITDLFAPVRFNSIRHYLAVLPAISILAGLGLNLLYEWFSRSFRSSSRRFRCACLGFTLCFPFALQSWQMTTFHPYQGAFLNEVLMFYLPGKQAQNYFSVEYWGHAYKEGVQWLQKNAEKNAEIVVPVYPRIARYYMSKVVSKRLDENSEVSYVMSITHKSRYDNHPVLRRSDRNLEPVFEIQRQKGVLLKIFKISKGGKDDGQ